MLNFTKKRIVSLVLVVAMLLGAIPADTFRLFAWAVDSNGSDATEQQSVTELGEFTNPFKPETQFTLPDGTTTTSQSYRIPAMVTLDDGTIVAAVDIRWNTTYDGGGLDTLVARSTDGGATWSYTLANYLDDNATGQYLNVYNANHTTFIDPSLVVAEDGKTVYMLVDLYAAGIALNGNGSQKAPSTDVGFNADGYLKLSSNNRASYGYYLKDGKIWANGASEPEEGYEVDEYFNITYKAATGEMITSNLFYAGSPFKVAQTGFLYLTKSTDGGATWSAPTLLDLKTNTEQICLVAPGNGITMKNGTMVFPVYSYKGGETTQQMGCVYSTDGGKTWQRSANFTGSSSFSSESAVVDLGNNNLRFFYRSNNKVLSYADLNLTTGTWSGEGNPVDSNGNKIPVNSDTQLSAITYSRTMDGKQVVLISCPTGPNEAGSDNNNGSFRTNGKIHVLVVEEDYTMTLKNAVNLFKTAATSQLPQTNGDYFTEEQGFFSYSSLTERSDGSVAILYENSQSGWGAGTATDKKGFTINGKHFDQFTLVGGMFAGEGEREKVMLKSDLSQVTLYGDPASNMTDEVTIDASLLDGVYYISDAYYDVATKTLLYKLELCVGMSWPEEYEDYRYIPASMVEQTDQGIAYPIVDFTNPAPIANSAAVTPAVTPYARRSLFASPAQTAYAMTRAGANDALVMSKVVKDNNDGTYTITLEAYTTGTVKVTKVSQPMDIILVLDQSYSMRYCIYCGSTNTSGNCSKASVTYTPVTTGNGSGEYYVKNADNSYTRVYYCSGSGNRCTAGWYTSQHWNSHGGTRVTEQVYQRSSGTHVRRDVALMAAAQAFVNNVYEKSAGPDGKYETEDDVAHRIAVVGFAKEGDETEIMTYGGTGGQFVVDSRCTDDVCKNSLQYTNTTAGQNIITAAVQAVSANATSTNSDLGMELATKIYKNNPVTDRDRITIMFTDGAPSQNATSFNATVANGAIAEAYTQKNTYGATVYTVGIFDGADASNPTKLPSDSGSPNRENRYMHLVSSNYLTAQSLTNTGTINSKVDDTQSYYLSASSTEALNAIFVAMSENVQGSTPIELGAETVVKDIITPQFTLPANTTDVSVKQYDCLTYDSETGAATWATQGTVLTNAVTINSADHSVDVTGFDFTHNYVAQEARAEDGGDGERDFHGRKLVIVFTIQPDPDFLGGDDVQTNDEKSGIYSKGELVKAFTPGSVDVELKEIENSAQDKHIYLGNTLDLTGILNLEVKASSSGKTLQAIANRINNAYVELFYEVTLSDQTIYTYTIEDGKLWNEGVWRQGDVEVDMSALEISSDTVYSVKCTMTSVNERSNTQATNSGTANVYVYKPTVTFKDSVQDYNKTLNMGTDVNSFLNAHYVSTIWKHGDTLSTAVTMDGTAPEITFAYTYANSGAFTGHVMHSTTDVPVTVTATIQGTGTALTSGVTFAHEACTHAEWPADAQFIVHVKNALTSLTINKAGWNSSDPNQTFLFTVTGKDANDADIELTVTVHQNGSVTIDGLIIGNEYTVVEKTDWSWRYNFQSVAVNKATVTESLANGAKIVIEANGSITFTNTRAEEQWLDGDSWCDNLFK